MHVEVSVALNFVISYLYNKLPRRRVDIFGDELQKQLKKKFEGHWYPEKPFKGSAFRCIRVSGVNMDPVMENAARDCGLSIDEIKEYLPADLTLWIDPCEVSYRIGEKGQAKILYSDKAAQIQSRVNELDVPETLEPEIQTVTKGFNPEAQSFKPIDSLSASMNNLTVSPSSPTPQVGTGWRTSPASPANLAPIIPASNFPGKSNSTPNFTAATFAQTKFGSTKLKSQAKRPTRLSPTEMGSYMKHRSPVPQLNFGTAIPNGHSRTLSPRQEYLDPQGRVAMFPPQRPQHLSPTGLSPMGGSMGDLYAGGWAVGDNFSGVRTPMSLGSPSPDGNKSLVENLAQMQSSQGGLHNLLVANS